MIGLEHASVPGRSVSRAAATPAPEEGIMAIFHDPMSDASVRANGPEADAGDPLARLEAITTPSQRLPEGPVPVPTGWSDQLTGTDGPRYWDRMIISEGARVRRYKRPATIVLVEIAGLARLSEQWGPDVGARTLFVAARTLSREIRTSDHIARIEPLRFGILLTETTEIAAINFVERARVACERELRVASEIVAVAFGWASPPSKGDLADAATVAARRLEAELRQL
jgi:diguanylate cyclase (GGDEF)-like protein